MLKINNEKRLVAFILIILFGFPIQFIDKNAISQENSSKENFVAFNSSFNSLIPFEPIFINSNDDFLSYGFPGSGTQEEPYIIQNYNITTNSYKAISINSTSKNFIIKNCFINSKKIGITIINILQGTAEIYNNTIVNQFTGISYIDYYPRVPDPENITGNEPLLRNKYVAIISSNEVYKNTYGIGVQYYRNSTSFLIEKNICNYNDRRGIDIFGCANSTINMNQCNFNSYIGISCTATNLTITENTFNFNQIGMSIRGEYSEISDNDISYNEIGLVLGGSFCIVQRNIIEKNTKFGIESTTSSYKTKITENEINENLFGFRGVGYLISCSFNLFKENKNYAIYLNGTLKFETQLYFAFNFTFHHNDFIGNNNKGSSQAYDEGTNTKWFDEITLEGNYWDDLARKREYSIDGPYNRLDPYPLKKPVIYLKTKYPTFLLLLGIFLSAILLRKKKL